MGFRENRNVHQVDGYHLPDTDGTANDVLVTNADGTTTWKNVSTLVSGSTILETFMPEFPDTVKINDGSNNDIDIDFKNSGSPEWENYYEATTEEVTMQDMSMYFMYEIPQNFDSFDTDHAIDVVLNTKTNTNTDNKLDIIVYKKGTAGAISTDSDLTSSVGETKLIHVITASDLSSGSFVAGDIIVIRINYYVTATNYAQIYSISIKYATA